MATQTTHYNLTKPDLTDLVDVTVLNDNADIIDDAIYAASQSGGAAMIESSVEATTTSAHAYAVGDYFIYNDTLYRATAAIAIGDTITPDTNCVATTVMTEVEAGGGGGGGTSDYTQLSNKPQINGNTLAGNKTGADLGLVNAVTGKQLSTEDYTTAEKTKLAGIEAQANKTVIDDTLTNTGEAADAKAVGDEISGVKNTLSNLGLTVVDGKLCAVYNVA